MHERARGKRMFLAAGSLVVAALLGGCPLAREVTPATTGARRTEQGTPGGLEESFRAYVDVLAAEDMEGRGLGTQGLSRATSWLEQRLRALDLAPAFESGYRQSFPVKTGVALAAGNRLEGVADGDWTPLGMSSPGSFSGELAFVGYGLEAPEPGYRELDGMDLRGKVVLMLRYEPQEKDDTSRFDGRRPSRWSALRYKVLQARERGAAAVVFVTGPLQDEERDRLPVLHNDGPESPAGLPVLQVRTSVAQRWLQAAGVDLRAFQESVDRDLTPRSRDTTGTWVRGTVSLEVTRTETENIAGVIPGRGALAEEVLLIGAHYDHLGYGGPGSLRPGSTTVHPGADDNASGTAVALLLAEELQRVLAPAKEHRTVVVTFFSAEEVGLAGSSWFVAHPPRPLGRMVAMLNLDMVGRLRDAPLLALGSETAPEWEAALARAAQRAELRVTGQGGGYGPSDHMSFHAAGVPVLHLFTGAHEAYHTPDDTPALLDVPGAARVARFTRALAEELALGRLTPTYVRSTAPAPGGDARGHGAWLGTLPDYSALEATSGGVRLAGTRQGGPAELAGLRAGDVLVGLAGTRIENLHDMTFALQDHKPGDLVEVVVLREGRRLMLRATLGSRSAMTSEGGGQPPAHAPAKGP